MPLKCSFPQHIDFPAEQGIFHSHLPDGQGQVVWPPGGGGGGTPL